MTTPTRHPANHPTQHFSVVVAEISQRWDLQLDVSTTSDTPSKRASACVNWLKCLFYKKELEAPMKRFEQSARQEMSFWKYKPAGEADTLPPPTNLKNGSISQGQRDKLLQLLKDVLEPEVKRVREELKLTGSKNTATPQLTTPSRDVHPAFPDDSPIPITPALKPKRTLDGFLEPKSISKKSKVEEQSVLGKIDDVPVTTRKTPTINRTKATQGLSASTNTSLPNWGATKPQLRRESTSMSSVDSNVSTLFSQVSKEPISANTSFSSDIVRIPGDGKIERSRFSQSFSRFEHDSGVENFPSTTTLIASTPRSALEEIQERLEGVFPILPLCLEKTPLGIRYEMMRVFLHAGVPLTSLDQSQIPKASDVEKYEDMWKWLKSLPTLAGKKFPPKSDSTAWNMSLSTFRARSKRVHMSGALRLSESVEGPLFKFQLHQLQTELSHRLGRRFGHDRFIEISMPLLENPKKLPKNATKLMETAGKAGRDCIIDWLHKGGHGFLGRYWGPFYVKERGRKKNKNTLIDDDDDAEALTTRKICLFATGGVDFHKKYTISPPGEAVDSHSEMTVEAMLDWLLSIERNGDQSFLKFYSRISLGLSTTYATVVLHHNQIRKKSNDICSSRTNEVMNDGCGRMSMKLAKKVSDGLGLLTVPSAFQGRIGESKGLWIVDYDTTGTSDQIWIETYPSQRKWKRIDSFSFSHENDDDHRTFEVLKWSSPLKSATLTLQFLPLLEDRGVPREAISTLLVKGLDYETDQMVAAINNPLSFRKWLREQHSSVPERLKTGVVRFSGGRPDSPEETQNMLLDAGFDPKRLGYARELARKSFKRHCDLLKEKLNIKVGLSTYAYIAVDFQGILQPNEIHVCFSTPFHDEISGNTMLELEDVDVLIARSPAHFVSDIQKVRAVFRPQLMKYKDIVILPSTGDSPLAGLLSGGDYDGDTVWLCFDPDIVKNFENAPTPTQPDLLKTPNRNNPFLRKDATKLQSFLPDGPLSFTHFLHQSFDFNFRSSYLGICTNYKEELCYKQNNVSSESAVLLSTLLSSLVDQAKQGYVFSDEDWQRFRSHVSKMADKQRKARSADKHGHIRDYLAKVAEETTEKALKNYHDLLEDAQYFDPDLIKCAKTFSEIAQSSEAHKAILRRLEEDIESIKSFWSSKFSRRDKATDESKPDSKSFKDAVNTCFDKWQDIQPVGEKWLEDSLLQNGWTQPDHSQWALLKASVLFKSYETRNIHSKGWSMQAFPWWMACRQLCLLKAMAINKNFNAVNPAMYAALRPDVSFIKMTESEEFAPGFQEAKIEVEQMGDGNDEEKYDEEKYDHDDEDEDVFFSTEE